LPSGKQRRREVHYGLGGKLLKFSYTFLEFLGTYRLPFFILDTRIAPAVKVSAVPQPAADLEPTT
jgi:hypothetical protein